MKPSALHSSEPTPLWTKNSPSGSYFFLTASESSVIAPPVRVLPSVFEVIALTDVRSRIRHECAKLTHALIDAFRGLTPRLHRRLMPGNPRICGSLGVAHDSQSEGGQHGGIHCRIFRRGNRVGRRSGETLIEVQFKV